MSPIRYRRTSVRTALGITTEEKRIKRELGITALLRPFRWWGNEKRTLKRDVGYYSPEAKFVRHVFPHALGKLVLIALGLLLIPFMLGWILKPTAPPTPTEESPTRTTLLPETHRAK